MKITIFIFMLFASATIWGQDHIIQPDGTKQNGTIISITKNKLVFKNKTGDLDEYKIDQLHAIFISNSKFILKGVQLNNSLFEKNDNGIYIEMLNNPIVKNNSSSKTHSGPTTTNVNINAENSSSLSITSEDETPKAKLILNCDDCSNAGTLIMISADKLTKVKWTFDFQEGSAFPMKMDIDSGKEYNFTFKDENNQSIKKKVKIESGVNIIDVFQ